MNIENKTDIDNKITSIITSLRIDKKIRDAEWSKSVSCEIGILCNYLSSIRSLDNELFDNDKLKLATKILAVIQYAKESGVQEAKKRTLNLSFLKKNTPQPSNTYLDAELVNYLFSALNNLKEDWCLKYISDEIRSCKSSENLKPLVQWLEKLNISLSLQIVNLYNAKPSFVSDEEWIIFIINHSTKSAKKDFFQFDKNTIEILNSIVNEKSKDEIKLAIVEQIYHLSQINPFLLFRPEIARYLSITRESKSKKLYSLTTQICGRYVETFTEISKFNLNRDDVNNLQNIWSIYESLLSKKDTVKKNDVVLSLISSADTNARENLSQGIEYLAADLLSTWEELQESIKSDSNFQELSNKIEILKTNLNISQYSLKGEVINYDPIFQEPISKDFVVIDKVKVFKPGFFQTRPNGTAKVIKKALVSS